MGAVGFYLPDDAPVVVAGAGTIGCFIGGLLLRAGRKVSFLGRPRMVEELQSHGLHLTDLAGLDEPISAARLTVSADPAVLRDARLVLVTVKSGATGDMAREIAAQTSPDTVIVSLQNGIDNPETLRAGASTAGRCWRGWWASTWCIWARAAFIAPLPGSWSFKLDGRTFWRCCRCPAWTSRRASI